LLDHCNDSNYLAGYFEFLSRLVAQTSIAQLTPVILQLAAAPSVGQGPVDIDRVVVFSKPSQFLGKDINADFR
jgi:hypothetical protein